MSRKSQINKKFGEIALENFERIEYGLTGSGVTRVTRVRVGNWP